MPKKTFKKLKKLDVKLLKKLSRRQWFVYVGMVFLAALVLTQMWQTYRLRHSLDFIDSLETNNAKVIQEMELAKDFLTDFGADLNQIREYLLLPTNDYDFAALGDVDHGGNVVEEEDLTSLVFEFVGQLGEYEKNKELYEANLAAFNTFIADGIWAENQLLLNGYTVKDSTLNEVQLLDMQLELDGSFSVSTYNGEMEFVDDQSVEEVIEELKNFIVNDLASLRALIAEVNEQRIYLRDTFLPSEEMQRELEFHGMIVSDELSDKERFYYEFYNGDGTAVASIEVSRLDAGRWLLIGESSYEPTVENLSEHVDARTRLQVLIETNAAELDQLVVDPAFTIALEQAGLALGEITEDDSGIYYPFVDVDGVVIRIMYLDKTSGEVKVKDGEQVDTLAAAIESLESYGKKKLWSYPRPCLNILA